MVHIYNIYIYKHTFTQTDIYKLPHRLSILSLLLSFLPSGSVDEAYMHKMGPFFLVSDGVQCHSHFHVVSCEALSYRFLPCLCLSSATLCSFHVAIYPACW